MKTFISGFLLASLLALQAGENSVVGDVESPTTHSRSKFRDPVDGCFDLS